MAKYKCEKSLETIRSDATRSLSCVKNHENEFPGVCGASTTSSAAPPHANCAVGLNLRPLELHFVRAAKPPTTALFFAHLLSPHHHQFVLGKHLGYVP